MDLFLLRHGIAESRASSGRDQDRSLTSDGRMGLREVIERAVADLPGFAPRWIIASPYLRAQQSAQIAAQVLAQSLGYDEPILPSTRLTPESSPEELWQEVREVGEGPLLLVAHNPLLTDAAVWLTGSGHGMIEFRPATLVALSFEQWTPAPACVFQTKLDA